jgi:hypothetical protein
VSAPRVALSGTCDAAWCCVAVRKAVPFQCITLLCDPGESGNAPLEEQVLLPESGFPHSPDRESPHSRHDLTQGSVPGHLVRLALPLAAGRLGSRNFLYAAPAIWMAGRAGFTLRRLWLLSVASVTMQAGISLWLLQRELRRTIDSRVIGWSDGRTPDRPTVRPSV